MAKKTKPSSMFNVNLDVTDNKDETSCKSEVIQISKNPNPDLLEDIKKLQKENVNLIEQKTELENKILDYINEIDKLKSKNDISVEILKLQKELELIQNLNDEYLMKISDLSFENANLKSQLTEISNNQTHTVINQNNINKNISINSRRNSSGYSDWN